MYSENDYRYYLEHSAKGSQRKDHKYISREWKGNRWEYTYKDGSSGSKQRRGKPDLGAAKRKATAENKLKEYSKVLNMLDNKISGVSTSFRPAMVEYGKSKIYNAGKARDEAARAAGINLASNVRMLNNERTKAKENKNIELLSRSRAHDQEEADIKSNQIKLYERKISLIRKRMSELGKKYTEAKKSGSEDRYKYRGELSELNEELKEFEKEIKRIKESSPNNAYYPSKAGYIKEKELSEMGRYADMKKRSSKK